MLGNLPDNEIYAEVCFNLFVCMDPNGSCIQEIPKEELEARNEDKIINVFHYSRDPQRAHGIPFRFVAKPNEKFSDTKKRIQDRVGVSDKEMAKYRFALIQSAGFKQPTYLEDGTSRGQVSSTVKLTVHIRRRRLRTQVRGR